MHTYDYVKIGFNPKYSLLAFLYLQCAIPFVATESVPFTPLAENPCMDYSLDGCVIDEDLIVQVISGISQQECQALCAVVYKGICNFFTFDITTSKCELTEQHLDDYVDSCSGIAAPPTPSVETCLSSSDPCKVNLLGSTLT